MRRIAPALVGLLLFLGPSGAQALGGAQAPRGRSETVKISGRYGTFKFNPRNASVEQGTKVIWKNPTNVDHTVTAYGHGWTKDTALSSDDTTSFRFNRSRTYKYYCTLHGTLTSGDCSDMCGKIVVH